QYTVQQNPSNKQGNTLRFGRAGSEGSSASCLCSHKLSKVLVNNRQIATGLAARQACQRYLTKTGLEVQFTIDQTMPLDTLFSEGFDPRNCDTNASCHECTHRFI